MTSARIVRSAWARNATALGLALLFVASVARAAPRTSEPATFDTKSPATSDAKFAATSEAKIPATSVAKINGTIVLMGETFALPDDLCRELVSGARAGESVLIRLSTSHDAAALDPLSACTPARDPIVLDPSARHAGDDRVLCQRTQSAGSIVLVGGAYLDWYALLLPGEKRSGLALALTDASRSGALVIASGAAASFLADWALVDRVALNRLRRNPRDASEHTLVRGLGLVPGFTIDASGAPRSSVARLIELAAKGSSETALYLDGAVAWIARGESQDSADVRGSGAALVFDLSAASWQYRALRGGRLAILGEREHWNPRVRSAHPATPSARDSSENGIEPTAHESADSSSARVPLDAASLRREIARRRTTPRPATPTFVVSSMSLRLAPDPVTDSSAKSTAPAGIAFEVTWDRP